MRVVYDGGNVYWVRWVSWPMEQQRRNENLIQGAQTTLRIVETLRELDGAGITKISEALGLPKSSVHNYLNTLEEMGYVLKEDNQYQLGTRFLRLGAAARNQWAIYKIAKTEVTRLARETTELANLAIEENGEGVYLFRNCGSQSVNVDVHTGSRFAMHVTALGKAMLAHKPKNYVNYVIDEHALERKTENTITTRVELFDELELVREQGVAFDREERINGLHCVAAPICDGDTAVGAISIAGPTSRLKGDTFEEEIPKLLRDAANVIELNVTFCE